MPNINEILEERGKRYGSFKDHAACTQSLKDVLHLWLMKSGVYQFVTPSQHESLDMICHKIGRIVCGDPSYIDSWVDIVGYATLIVNELKEEEEKKNEVRKV